MDKLIKILTLIITLITIIKEIYDKWKDSKNKSN